MNNSTNNNNNNNNTNNRMPELSGTQTQKNLMTAAGGEARANTKYNLYAGTAYEEGLATVGDLLENLSHQEKEHAEIWMNYLGEIGTTQKNLENAIFAENYEADSMYPEFQRIAQEEGFDEIANKFRMVGEIEAHHRDLLKNVLNEYNEGTLYAGGNDDTMWQCTNCGYIVSGPEAPERCPVCYYIRGYFQRLGNQQ